MHENTDTPVWVKLQGDRSQKVSYTQLATIPKKAASEVGIEKPTNPQWFRKSRASVAALRQGYSIDDMRQAFGWNQKAATPEHYVAKFGKQASRDLAEIEGADVEKGDRTKKIAPVKCPNCSQYTPRFRETCLWCGTGVDPEASRDADTAVRAMKESSNESYKKLVRLAANGELDEENINFGEMFADIVREDPEAIDKIRELFDMQDRRGD
jgi:hypothetical protein